MKTYTITFFNGEKVEQKADVFSVGNQFIEFSKKAEENRGLDITAVFNAAHVVSVQEKE